MVKRFRIAVCADDPELREGITGFLSSAAHDVRVVSTAVAPPHVPFDLLVVVWEPADEPAVVAALQQKTNARATLYVVRSSADANLVHEGATITLPFSRRALVERVAALCQASGATEALALPFEIGGMRIDERERISVDGARVVLTRIEQRLLLALLRAGGEPVNRRELLISVWNVKPDIDTRTIDTHVNRLRTKLGRAGERLLCIRRKGYVFRIDP